MSLIESEHTAELLGKAFGGDLDESLNYTLCDGT
jgi:hypothetical protein